MRRMLLVLAMLTMLGLMMLGLAVPAFADGCGTAYTHIKETPVQSTSAGGPVIDAVLNKCGGG